jgi:hypothetical protein
LGVKGWQSSAAGEPCEGCGQKKIVNHDLLPGAWQKGNCEVARAGCSIAAGWPGRRIACRPTIIQRIITPCREAGQQPFSKRPAGTISLWSERRKTGCDSTELASVRRARADETVPASQSINAG